jgi:hypothetical protein
MLTFGRGLRQLLELVRRIRSPERAGLFKCIDPADAINKSRHHVVLDPKSPATLTLDVTALSPEESAAAILAHIRSCAPDGAVSIDAGRP